MDPTLMESKYRLLKWIHFPTNRGSQGGNVTFLYAKGKRHITVYKHGLGLSIMFSFCLLLPDKLDNSVSSCKLFIIHGILFRYITILSRK